MTWTPRQPTVGQNALHLNPLLLYASLEDCVSDQASKGLGDKKARDVCSLLARGITQNSSHVSAGFSMNVSDFWEDEKFLYIPCTATSEGVHNGAYKSAKELEKGFPFFENTPICILHPPDRGIMGTDEVHGWIRKTKFDPRTAAWKGVAHFIKDESQLREMGHDDDSVRAHFAMLDAIRAGARFDGSIGYWHSTVDEPGTYKGIRYDRKEVNLLPDHLAVVDRGASDWHMGSGFGRNSNEDEEKPPLDLTNPTKSTYRLGYEGGVERPPSTWVGYSEAAEDGHQHNVWATFGTDPVTKKELLEVHVTQTHNGDPNDAHTHEWKETGLSKKNGHSHKMGPGFEKWLSDNRAWLKDHAEGIDVSAKETPYRGKTGTTIFDYIFGKRRRTGKARPSEPTLETNSKSANTYKLPAELLSRRHSMSPDKDQVVVARLGINELSEMNPEVKRLITQNQVLERRTRILTANAKQADEKVKTLTKSLSRYEANDRKVRLMERNRLITDICSVTKESPKAYAALGLNAIKQTHAAVVKAASFGANLSGNAFGDKETKHQEEELAEGGMGFDMECEDEDKKDEVFSESGEDAPMEKKDDEDEEEVFTLDGEAGEPELLKAKASKGGYEDYGDARTDQGPTPNRRADRTLLANRIQEGFKAQRRKASPESPSEPKVSQNAEKSMSVYERIALNQRKKTPGDEN